MGGTARTMTAVMMTLTLTVMLAAVHLVSAYDLWSRINPRDLSFYQPDATTAAHPLTGETKVRNVILCIGDGMGLSQVTLASMRVGGLDGRLHMERMPVGGFVRTHSADAWVTDSAAAATAMATGVKTNNGMIGVDPQGRPWRTILEAAKDKGMATGLVATATISHATPAAFDSHIDSRKTEDTIVEQLIGGRANVLFGGGRRYFLPKTDRDSGRKDDRDLIAEAKEAGYAYVQTARELDAVRHPYMLGLFQLDAMTTAPPEPSLAALTRKAIDVLDAVKVESTGEKAGFFLMIEGGQIDWACHDNKADHVVRQVLLFDQAVEAAIDFALKDGKTLVIVAADHETGGLTLSSGDKRGPGAHWASKGHTGTPVPLWALGPGAKRFAGVCDNTDIPTRIAQLLDIRPFPQAME